MDFPERGKITIKNSVEEEEKSKVPKSRRTKPDRFPWNLTILVEGVVIPEEVRANPDQWVEIGEEHHGAGRVIIIL